MKLAFDRKRLHLRLWFGARFAMFIALKILKHYDREAVAVLRPIGKSLIKLLRESKRYHGKIKIVEVESDGMRISLKL